MPWGNDSNNNPGDNNKNSGNKKSPWGSLPKPSANRPENNSSKKPGFTGNGGGGFGGIDLEKFFKDPKRNTDINISPKFLLGILAVGVILWLLSGVFTVGPAEEGVILRFGKYTRTVKSGLDIHMPYPFEEVIKVPVTKVNSVEVGFRSGSTGSRSKRSQNVSETAVPAESLMITGDTNIADVSFEVQWKVRDAQSYLFNIREPEQTVKAVAESAMREIIGRTTFEVATGEGRQEIETSAKDIIQSVLDNYNSGIEILMLQLRPVQNPGPVMDAFLDVETAKQDRETAINRGKAYANDIIPRARGDAERIIQEAEAYKSQVISVATGEAQRFASVLKEYNTARDITKKRIYLETMQQILSGTDKVIIDGKNGVTPYLPLPELKKRAAQPTQEVKN